jgi:hypothetical protein
MMAERAIISGCQHLKPEILESSKKRLQFLPVPGAKNHCRPLGLMGLLRQTTGEKEHGGNPHAAAYQAGMAGISKDKPLAEWAEK